MMGNANARLRLTLVVVSLGFPQETPTLAPSREARCQVRSLRLRHLPLAVSATSVLGHMGGRAKVLQDGEEDTRINDRQSPVGGVVALIPVGAAWQV